MQNLLELVLFYLNEINDDNKICLLHIGRQRINYHNTEKVEYINIQTLDSDLYDLCVLASDVFLSINAVSVSLTKAVLNDIPSILLINEKVLNFLEMQDTVNKLPPKYREIVNRIQIAYPYYASTFGWYKFLKPIMEENPYYESFSIIPVFSYSKMIAAIRKALNSNEYFIEYHTNLDRYRKYLLGLENSNAIMKMINTQQSEKRQA